MLSFVDIQREMSGAQAGRLEVEPLLPEQLQPASIDVRLGSEFVVWREPPAQGAWGYVDLAKVQDPSWTRREVVAAHQNFILPSKGFALATTIETVSIPRHLVARLEGRSSLGRMGLLVHVTAGFIDPGFRGQITLELYNANPNPLMLHPGMRIAQLSFYQLMTPVERGYEGKYQDQVGATSSRISDDFRGRK